MNRILTDMISRVDVAGPLTVTLPLNDGIYTFLHPPSGMVERYGRAGELNARVNSQSENVAEADHALSSPTLAFPGWRVQTAVFNLCRYLLVESAVQDRRGLLLRLATGFYFAVACFVMSNTHSQAGDQLAISEIFAEQHVEGVALDVHRQATKLSPDDRYDFLSNWVLPGADHGTLRMNIGFTQTNPGPFSADYSFIDSDENETRTRQPSGGELVSPAWDLVGDAKLTGQLGDLRKRVAQWQPLVQRDGELSRAAMLTLIDIALVDEAAAVKSAEELLQAAMANSAKAGPTPAELLVFTHGLKFDFLREAIAAGSERYIAWMNAAFSRSPFHRHFKSVRSQLRAFQLIALEKPTVPLAVQPVKQWSVVSRSRAKSRGMGCPVSEWDYQPGFVQNVASHDEDYLYFRVPLRGNFEVECDVTGFGWMDSHLMFGGLWVAPVYTHSGYDLGNFRMTQPRVAFSPPMTKTKEWIHYRTVVRDRVISTYFNGRLMRQGMVTRDHDPWLAIRSSPRHDGAVRNLRITGQPDVPEEIRLSVDPSFDGWASYFDHRVGRSNGEWRQVGRSTAGGEIVGTRSGRPSDFVTSLLNAFVNPAQNTQDAPKLPAYKERLLRYHRPMLEDGTIDYDFYYSPGSMLVHPALDRLAFLLRPDGVRIHWVTDGKHDRSDLSPANVYDEPANRRGPEQLPLKPGDWNHLQLRLNDDTVTLSLNRQVVYERTLQPTNQRTFGLFHFADETQARIRNIVWRGDWPRELPPLAEQELTIDDISLLDRGSENLAAVFEHDFAKDELPREQFVIQRGDPNAHVRHVEDGVLTTRPGIGGYRNVTIAPALSVRGDFDIIASYRKFQSTAVKDGNGTALLLTILDNSTADELIVSRKHVHRMNGTQEHVAQCFTVSRHPDGERRYYFGGVPMEESSGRLRLSRRGNQAYFLTAEGDSPYFQLRGQREVATDDLQNQGLRLLTQIYQKGGEVGVVWNHLIVRADSLSGRAIEDFDSQLVALNEEREKLESEFEFDFSKQGPPEALFYRWTDIRPWKKEDGGLLIVAPGKETWTSAGSSLRKTVTGDFDISVTFDAKKLERPMAGKRCSVYLQLELSDEARTQASAIFTNNDTGDTELIAQVREPLGKGKYNYRPLGSMNSGNVTALRITRRGERLTFLASPEDSPHDRIIGYLDRPAAPIPESCIRFMVHTGDPKLTTHVVWKSIDVRADAISQTEPLVPVDSPARFP